MRMVLILMLRACRSNYFSDFFVLIACLFIFGLAALIRGQDVNSDLLNYHFYNGYAFLHHRYSIDVVPALLQSYLNPVLDVMNYGLLIWQNPKVTMFILGMLSGLSVFVLYKIAKLFFSDNYFYIFLAVTIGVTGAGHLGLLNSTINDTKINLLILTALYLFLRSISLSCEERQR